MTPRRSFFRSLALLGAGAVGCPSVFVPKFEPVRWKRETHIVLEINPEWAEAEYVQSYNLDEHLAGAFVKRKQAKCYMADARYQMNENGILVVVPLYRVRKEVRRGSPLPPTALTQGQLIAFARALRNDDSYG